MKNHHRLAGIAVVVCLAASLGAAVCLRAAPCNNTVGPDVIVWEIGQPNGADVQNWGAVGDITAFSVATTSCNKGNADLSWNPDTAQHPVIAQNLYRLSNTPDTSTGEVVTRFEQIGMAWLKHGFFATNAHDCCDNCTTVDPQGLRLGPNCSDLYTAWLNGGNQSGESLRMLGPRSTVNAATGVFTYPFQPLQNPNAIDRRLQVNRADVPPNDNSVYFVEAQYVTADDAAAGNKNNNASYRQAQLTNNGTTLQMSMSAAHPTIREKTAINAWTSVTPQARLFEVEVPHDGHLTIGLCSTRLQSGLYHHELAIHNLNSDRSVQAVRINQPGGAITRPGFHAPLYHSGEPYSNAPWTATVSGSSIQWATETIGVNPNANALRWSTCYSFRYESESLPTDVELTLFKPGDPVSVRTSLAGQIVGSPVPGADHLKTPWAALPGAISLGKVGSEGAVVHLARPEGVQESIASATLAGNRVEVNAVPSRDDRSKGWDLHIRKAPGAKPGYFESVLTIEPASKGRPKLMVRVSGSVVD